jgi:hypothetical protein
MLIHNLMDRRKTNITSTDNALIARSLMIQITRINDRIILRRELMTPEQLGAINCVIHAR